jgi:hypothetical protein
MNIKITNIHCKVGTGSLVFFKSLPGLSRTLNFLNKNHQSQAVTIVIKKRIKTFMINCPQIKRISKRNVMITLKNTSIIKNLTLTHNKLNDNIKEEKHIEQKSIIIEFIKEITIMKHS